MTASAIVIATPHSRNDSLEQRVRERLAGYRIVRLRTKQDLSFHSLRTIGPDYVFFPHWSWVITEEVHSHFNCVIFHVTDLPYGRGGSPIQNLIVRGHKETKLTALRCVSELDAGPVYLKRPLSLAGTAEEILHRASLLMEEMIVEIVESRPTPTQQRGEVAYFKRRQPADGDLVPLETLEQIYDFIRMLDAKGYPPAFISIGHLNLEFSEASLQKEFVEAKVRIRREIR